MRNARKSSRPLDMKSTSDRDTTRLKWEENVKGEQDFRPPAFRDYVVEHKAIPWPRKEQGAASSVTTSLTVSSPHGWCSTAGVIFLISLQKNGLYFQFGMWTAEIRTVLRAYVLRQADVAG